MKTVLRRTVSLVMCALLLLQMVPAVSVHVHAEEGDMAFWEATYYMTGEMVDGATYLLVGKRETETDEGTVMSCWVLDFTGNTLELPSDSYDAANDTVTLSADLANSVKLTYRAETQSRGLMEFSDGSVLGVNDVGELRDAIHPLRFEYDSNTFVSENGYALVFWQSLNAAAPAFEAAADGSSGGFKIYMTCDHSSLTYNPKTATCYEEGLAEHWVCDVCGAVFWDADGLYETSADHLYMEGGHTFDKQPPQYVDEEYHSQYCVACESDVTAPHEVQFSKDELYHFGYCQMCSSQISKERHDFVLDEPEYSPAYCEGSSWVSLSCSHEACDATMELILSGTGHEMSPWYVISEATEEEPGEMVRYCLNCMDGIEYGTIPMLGHVHETLIPIPEQEPSCQEYGLAAHYLCQDCGCMYADKAGTEQVTDADLWLPSGDHSWGDWEKESTLTGNAHVRMWRSCESCGEVQAYAVEKTGHLHQLQKVEAKAAGCVVPGNIEYYVCTFDDQFDDSGMCIDYACSNLFRDEAGEELLLPDEQLIAATGHKMSAWELCDEGHARYCTCEGCNYREISGHIISPYAKNGSDPERCVLLCLACGGEVETETGHEISYEPCAEDEDCHEGTCFQCGSTFTLPHEWVPSDDGSGNSICESCGAVRVQENCTDHRPMVLPAVEATCASTGLTEGEQCGICGEILVEQQVIPAKPHKKFTISEREPTCTQSGHTYGEACNQCGVTLILSTELPATGHRWSRLTGKEPTQTEGGWWLCYCLEGCGEFMELPSPAHGHVHHLIPRKGMDPTCCAEGRMPYYVCAYEDGDLEEDEYDDSCGLWFADAEGTEQVMEVDLSIPATGKHEMGEWTVDHEADPEFIMYVRTCTLCGAPEYRPTPRETHQHTLIYLEEVEPTCTANGAKARYACATCPCIFEDAEGLVRMEEQDQIISVLGHDFGKWTEFDSDGHQRQCARCEIVQITTSHIESPLPGDPTGETCGKNCLLCNYRIKSGTHRYGSIKACTDRWQHQQSCENCGFQLVEDHEFGPWQYGSFINENTGESLLGHYRSCHCGATETSIEHLWDEGSELKPGYVTYRCIVDGCEAEKVDFLRCMHTCSDCGSCTADTPCPGQEPCECAQPEPLKTTEPTFLQNDTANPNETYLGDILVKKQDEGLDPNAKPGQEIPEEYAGFTVGIQEVPITDGQTGEAVSNPYTEYVEQALVGYSTKHLFDIHLLDGQGNVTESDGDAQYLIRLCLEEETVLALQKGLLRLAHITEKGIFFYGVDKGCTPFYKLEGDQAWFWADRFSPFALVEPEAPYFGREALATLANKDALLYAYDQIVMGVEACLDKITIYPVWEGPSLTIPELQMVMDAYTRDHTEHFWLKTKYSISYKKSSGLASAVKPQYSMTGKPLEEARAKFQAEVEDILHGVTSEMSEFERQLLIHDRLAARVTYDGSSEYAHDAYGALVEGKAVCQGYAEAFQYLLRRADIQSFIVTGIGINEEGEVPHAWNLVRIGDDYYHTDLTWNDAQDRPYHAYFNMNDHFITEDHEISVTAYPMKECVELEANYFKKMQTDLDDLDAHSKDAVAIKMKGSVNGVSFLLTESVTAEQFLYWFMANQKDIFTKADLINVEVQTPTYTCIGREAMIRFVAENGQPPHICGNGKREEGRKATCMAAGWKDYYSCSCGKLFREVACVNEITNLAAWKLGEGRTTADHDYGPMQTGKAMVHTADQLKDGLANYYQCADCEEYFTEGFVHTTWSSLILKAAHRYGDWVTDEEGHRRSCACGLTADEAVHGYLDEYDADCGICGYERAVELPDFAMIRPAVNNETGKMTVTLIGQAPLSAKIMVAVYDRNGRMLGISYADKTITVDQTGRTFTIVYDRAGTPKKVRAFVLESGFMPAMISEAIELQ